MLTRIAPFASAALAWIRAPGERSRRMELALFRQSQQLDTMVTMMSALSDKIAELKQAVETERAEHAQEVKDAVTRARAAWDADNEAEHKQALADMDAIIEKLNSPAPAFSPSGN